LVQLEGVETKVDFTGNLHEAIKLCPVSRPRDPQRWAFILDAPRPDASYSVHNNSLNNLLRGLNERVFYTDNNRTQPVQPGEAAFTMLKYFQQDFRSHHIDAWTLEQVRDSYTGSQFTRYSKAYDSLALEPLSKRDARVSTFVKCEKINFSAKADPAPRVIQPRDPRFNLSFGKWIKPMEHKIYRQLGKLYKYPCVAKGFDMFQMGDIMAKKWGEFRNPCGVGLDASRFDQHCSVQALQWTHSVYKRFNNDPDFARHLDMLLVNRGHGSCKDGYVKYQVEGRRMSGDMDTALGNCVLMVGMTYSLCRLLNIRHEVMDNGDDIVVIMERTDEARFRSHVADWYTDLGFKMKVEDTVYDLEKVEFCQMRPVFDGVRWRMVRNINSLAKDLVCCTNVRQIDSWIKAVGTGGYSLTKGIPVQSTFHQWLSGFGSRSKVSNWKAFQSHWTKAFGAKFDYGVAEEISPEARNSFERAFDVSVGQQIALEAMYCSLKDGQRAGPLGINERTTIQLDCLTKHHTNFGHIFET